MLTDQAATTALDHGGYGEDYRRLWRYRHGGEALVNLAIEGGFHLYGSADRTLVLVAAVRPGAAWTVRPTNDVEQVLASATWDGLEWDFSGDSDVWSSLPRWVMIQRARSQDEQDNLWRPEDARRSGLVKLAPGPQETDPLEWFWGRRYDHMYQGLHHPVAAPGTDLIVFGVQRSGELVLYNPATRHVVRKIPLADRGGNPDPYMARTRSGAWVIDYDTIVRLDLDTWEVLDSRKLQEPKPGMHANFVGNLWLPYDESFCLVARPFSGDVLVIDPETLSTIDVVPVGTQPLDAVILGEQIVSRDWNPRTLHTTQLPPSWDS